MTYFIIKKYSNKLSMKALVEKDIIMKKQEKEMRKAPHFFLCTFIKGTQGNRKTLGLSREALVEVMERKKTQEIGKKGKKLRKRGQEDKFHKS